MLHTTSSQDGEIWRVLIPTAGLLLSRGGEGGRGFWTQNLVYQKWPDQIFPIVNFVFSHYGHFGLGRGGGGFGGGVPPPLVFNYSKEALPHGVRITKCCTSVVRTTCRHFDMWGKAGGGGGAISTTPEKLHLDSPQL